jgi:alkylation response protein AidB-like acyl-CoA dehydrogenase
VTDQLEPASVAADVRGWLAEHWDADLALVEWRRRLQRAGWLTPSWPPAWGGRGLPPWAEGVVSRELADAGAVGPPPGAGMSLAAPTLLAHASEELNAALLAPTATGELTWCQLFSEPGSGSDLAGLATRAERDGDEWIVDGQKLWSTSAHHADLGLLLARTDPGVPKHQGITCFVLPMRQPGVEARPLRQMNRHASFNEVFLTGARIPGTHVVGTPGDGWRVAMTTLAHERGFATMRRVRFDAAAGRALREAQAEADEHAATYRWYPQRAGRADLLAPLARQLAVSTDAIVRQRLVAVESARRAHAWTADRAQAARSLGRAPGPEGSLGKLAASHVARSSAAAHGLVAGAHGLLDGPESLADGVVAEVLVSVPAQSIAGGTDEIQRTIVGERALGLPKEPAVDRDVPFRDRLAR